MATATITLTLNQSTGSYSLSKSDSTIFTSSSYSTYFTATSASQQTTKTKTAIVYFSASGSSSPSVNLATPSGDTDFFSYTSNIVADSSGTQWYGYFEDDVSAKRTVIVNGTTYSRSGTLVTYMHTATGLSSYTRYASCDFSYSATVYTLSSAYAKNQTLTIDDVTWILTDTNLTENSCTLTYSDSKPAYTFKVGSFISSNSPLYHYYGTDGDASIEDVATTVLSFVDGGDEDDYGAITESAAFSGNCFPTYPYIDDWNELLYISAFSPDDQKVVLKGSRPSFATQIAKVEGSSTTNVSLTISPNLSNNTITLKTSSSESTTINTIPMDGGICPTKLLAIIQAGGGAGGTAWWYANGHGGGSGAFCAVILELQGVYYWQLGIDPTAIAPTNYYTSVSSTAGRIIAYCYTSPYDSDASGDFTVGNGTSAGRPYESNSSNAGSTSWRPGTGGTITSTVGENQYFWFIKTVNGGDGGAVLGSTNSGAITDYEDWSWSSDEWKKTAGADCSEIYVVPTKRPASASSGNGKTYGGRSGGDNDEGEHKAPWGLGGGGAASAMGDGGAPYCDSYSYTGGGKEEMNGKGYGSGGGGAVSDNTTNTYLGGNGAPGIIFLYY